jgi:hypothetical protein
MPIDEFIIHVFCLVDDFIKEETSSTPLRKRGFSSHLTDSEVITMRLVGEYLGFGDEKPIWEYFKRHWLEWFPKLGCRTTFTRQSANLWFVTQKLQKQLLQKLDADIDDLHMCDGFPIPICHFKRAGFCRKFKGDGSYGYCASKEETYYGFKGNMIISGLGVITGITATAANVDERDSLCEIIDNIKGLLLGDKGLMRPSLKENLLKEGVNLQTPLRNNMKDERDPKIVKDIIGIRRLVETVIGQLTDRYKIQKMKARDLWHLTHRIIQKVTSHTMAIFINKYINPDNPLQLEKLVC